MFIFNCTLLHVSYCKFCICVNAVLNSKFSTWHKCIINVAFTEWNICTINEIYSIAVWEIAHCIYYSSDRIMNKVRYKNFKKEISVKLIHQIIDMCNFSVSSCYGRTNHLFLFFFMWIFPVGEYNFTFVLWNSSLISKSLDCILYSTFPRRTITDNDNRWYMLF